MTIWRVRIACWLLKATNNSEYVIFKAFPMQQQLPQRALVLRHIILSVIFF
jgi:hypothetical protein